MSAEKKGLSRQSQMILLLLALLPLWHSLGSYLPASSPAPEDSPYYIECLECGLQYACGPNGAIGMRCPHCARAEATMVFRTRGAPIWDLLVKLLVAIVAFLSIVVLIFAGHQKKKAAGPVSGQAPMQEEAAGEVKEQIKDEIKNWARDLVENRRKRQEKKAAGE
jgi:hypothetical protein